MACSTRCDSLPMTRRRPSTVAVMPPPAAAVKAVAGDVGEPALLGAADDRLGQGMLAAALRSRHQPQQLLLGHGAERPHLDHLGAAAGQRPGLVQDDRVDALRLLERGPVTHQDPGLRSLAGADHDRGRRGQPHGAGAGDDQHGDRGRERERQPWLRADQHPAGEGEEGQPHHHRNEVGRHVVSHPLDGCLRALCLFDEAHDLGEGRVATDTLGTHHERSRAVHGGADDRRADRFLDRERLPGQHRLVERGGPFHDGAVDRHPVPGPHPDQVADPDLVDGQVRLDALAQHAGGRGTQPQQSPHRTRGLAASSRLEPAAQQHQADDDRRRVEVGLQAEAGLEHHVRQQGHHQRVAVRGQGAHRHQRVHREIAVRQSPRRAHQEATAEDELDEGGRREHPDVDPLHGPPGAARPEHDGHHRQPDAGGGQCAPEQLAPLGRTRLRVRLLGGLVVRGLGAAIGADRVTGRLDGGHQAASVDHGGVEADGRPFGGEVHRGVRHAIGLAQESLDPVDARRTGHADDRQRQFGGRFGMLHGCTQYTTGEYHCFQPPGRLMGRGRQTRR